MADFLKAYERTIANEGGYKLTNIAGDRGVMTYAGISRRFHPSWPGWLQIDAHQVPSSSLVREFYKAEFWDKVRGDQIESQRIAESIYDFAVNADWRVAAKVAQVVVGVTPDGSIGDRTVAALNAADPAVFCLAFALGKLRRYADIVNRDRSQAKFLLGWVNRTLQELA